MLNRQRVVVEFLLRAPGPLSKLHLAELLFLCAREANAAEAMPFYDFFPHHVGPYSFSLEHDLRDLAAQGLVAVDGGRVSADGGVQARMTVSRLSNAQQIPARLTLHKYGALGLKELVAQVQGRYPEFTRRGLETAAARAGVVYTIGYEGRSADSFFDRLVRSGVTRIVDVRRNPYSRKGGFSKAPLQLFGRRLGIGYTHLPELGIASAERANLASDADYDALFERYERTTLRQQGEAIARVARLQAAEPAALLCFEADPARCHRGRLAKAVAAAGGMEIVHL